MLTRARAEMSKPGGVTDYESTKVGYEKYEIRNTRSAAVGQHKQKRRQ